MKSTSDIIITVFALAEFGATFLFAFLLILTWI